jgi:NADH-quinone oxidoreductase subunit N
MSKYNIFIVAAQGGYLWLVIIAVIGSMLSVYFYFKPILAMYFSGDPPQPKIATGTAYKVNIIICTILIITLGLVSGLIINLI